MGLFIFLNLTGESIDDISKTVYIKRDGIRYQIIRNGRPFHIKGVSGEGYIKELAEANGNTLRVYDTTNLEQVLDEAYKYNIAVIADIYLPKFNKKHNIYLDQEFKSNTASKIRALVGKYKNHPALLIWNLGNELDYPLPSGPESSGYKFIEVFNDFVDVIHNEDPNHPVSTCVAGPPLRTTLSINRNSPKIDLIGYNTFSNIKQIDFDRRELYYLSTLLSIPYYFAEWGPVGPWEVEKNKWLAELEQTSTQKGEVYSAIFNTYIKPLDKQCLGSLAFYWGHKIEGTPTWFNVFDEKGRKSQAYYSLRDVWSDSKSNQVIPPVIIEMKLAGDTSQNLVFKTGEVVDSEVFINENANQKIEFNWEIYENGWKKKKWKFDEELNKDAFPNQNLDTKNVMISMPEKEGAYRLFVYAYDSHGNFATANMPFYILNQND